MWQICQLLNLGPIVSLPQEGLIFDSLSSTKVKKIWFYRALALWQDYDVKCVQTILQEILDWVWKLCQAKVSKVMNNVSKRFFGAIVKIYGAKVDWGFLLHLCMNIGIFPSVSFFCIYSPHFLLYLKQRQLVRYYSNSMSLHLRNIHVDHHWSCSFSAAKTNNNSGTDYPKPMCNHAYVSKVSNIESSIPILDIVEKPQLLSPSRALYVMMCCYWHPACRPLFQFSLSLTPHYHSHPSKVATR